METRAIMRIRGGGGGGAGGVGGFGFPGKRERFERVELASSTAALVSERDHPRKPAAEQGKAIGIVARAVDAQPTGLLSSSARLSRWRRNG